MHDLQQRARSDEQKAEKFGVEIKIDGKEQKSMKDFHSRQAKKYIDRLRKLFPSEKDMVKYFFPQFSGDYKLDQQKFLQKCASLNQRTLNITDFQLIFNYLDVNHNGQLTANEFKLLIEKEHAALKKEDITLTKELEQQAIELFKSLDRDKNHVLDKREMFMGLQQLGLNPDNEELNAAFNKLDINKDQQITFKEFKFIVFEHLQKEILKVDELMYQIRRIFNQLVGNQSRKLNLHQFTQLLEILNIQLTEQELKSLFIELDKDKSGSIDIDELMLFISTQQDGLSDVAMGALNNIRSSHKLTLTDFREIFKSMPQTISQSFLRALNCKLKFLPSEKLQAEIDQTHLFFTNCRRNPYPNLQNYSYLQSEKSQFMIELKLIDVCLPGLGNQKIIEGIVGQEVRICYFDRTQNKFLGNIAIITGKLLPVSGVNAAETQKWIFDWRLCEGFDDQNTFICRLTQDQFWQDSKQEQFPWPKNIDIIFEFIMYYPKIIDKQQKLLGLSLGWCCLNLPLIQANSAQKLTLKLFAGSPQMPISLENKNKEKKLFSSLIQKFKPGNLAIGFQIIVVHGRKIQMNNNQNQLLAKLPPSIILSKSLLTLVGSYREFLAKEIYDGEIINLDVNQDNRVKTFLKVFNCKDLLEKVLFS